MVPLPPRSPTALVITRGRCPGDVARRGAAGDAPQAEVIEPPTGSPTGTARYESEAAGSVKEGAGEPAQLQAGQLSQREPGELAELAITGCRGTSDYVGFIDSGDVGGAVAVGVADLVIGPAEHVHQADQLDVGADLFAGLPDRCRGGRLAHVHGAAEDAPALVMAGMADPPPPARPLHGQGRPS